MPVEPRLTALFAFWAESALALAGQDAPDVLRAVPLIVDGRSMKPGREQLALGVAIRPLDDTLRDAVQWHRSLGGGRPGTGGVIRRPSSVQPGPNTNSSSHDFGQGEKTVALGPGSIAPHHEVGLVARAGQGA